MMTPGSPEAERIARIREAVQIAILVLDALGDREWKFLAGGSALAGLMKDDWCGHGFDETKVRWIPTAREISQAEVVDVWLAWLRSAEGASSIERIRSWAHGAPIWVLADREDCSERTINNRIDRSMVAMLREFGDEEVQIDVVDESSVPAYASSFTTEVPSHCATAEVRPSRVYIGGIGWMKGGRRLRRGRHLINERRLHAARRA